MGGGGQEREPQRQPQQKPDQGVQRQDQGGQRQGGQRQGGGFYLMIVSGG